MNAILKFFTFLSVFARRIGVCGKVGIIAGLLAGLLLTLLNDETGPILIDDPRAFYISLILTAIAWIVVIFILVFLVRLTFRSVALPSLFNCFLTCLATVFITKWLNAYPIAWIIGIIVGFLIGSILCRLNNFFRDVKN
jgi:fructose-specific phosphotransferase system IIC component